jgi:hypothetical protein
MIREKRIPTILGIILLIISLAAGVFLVTQGQEIFLRASPEITPNQTTITNLADNSLTISWITTKETSGFIQYGESSSLGSTIADDRDQLSGQTGSFTTHHVTVPNLKPDTTYYYKIGSGGRIFGDQRKPFEIKTAPLAQGLLPASDVATGAVHQQDDAPAEGAIVYLSMANVSGLSALVSSSGNWLIPLNTARAIDLSSFAKYDKEAQVVEISVEGGEMGQATALTTTKNDNPVPLIVLGNSYDFRQATGPQVEISPPELEAQISPIPVPITPGFTLEESLPTPTPGPGGLSIANPEEGENLNTPKPEFAGGGPGGKIIDIVVESPAYSGTVKVNDDGTWTWSPPADLEPGDHTIKISYGSFTLVRNFTVLAAEESDLPSFTATPSATISPTIPFAASPTPTPTLPTTGLTITPTITLTPTPTTALTITPTPTSLVATITPTPGGELTEAGILTPSLLAIIMGAGLILTGFVLKSRLAG